MLNESVDLLSICQELREQIAKREYDNIKNQINELEEQLESNIEFSLEEKFFALSTLAKFYRKVNNYNKAGSYCRQAIRLSKNIHKNYIETVIDTYLDYASLEIEYGQQSNARIELAKLLALLESKDYKEPYAYGAIFRSLGEISLDEENIESGLNQLEKSLDYFQKAVPSTHPVILESVNALSEVYIQIENYEKAVELYQHLLEAYQEAGDQISEARTFLRIGEIHFYINLKEARKIITKAIKQLDEIYQQDHLDIAKAVLMLAEIDENLSNFPRAINYYKQALRQLMQFYEEDHFLIVYVYSKIGTISIKTFKLKQAKEYLEKGLRLSKNYPKIRQQFLYALGKIYSDEEAFDKASTVFLEFMQRLEQEGRRKSIAYGNTLQAIAYNELRQDKFEDALHNYEKALEIYQSIPNCKEEKGLTYIRLAYCYENIQAKDVEKAEILYEKGFKLIEKVRNPDLLEEALAGMIDFFKRNNNPKKRRIYEDKFVKLQTARVNT